MADQNVTPTRFGNKGGNRGRITLLALAALVLVAILTSFYTVDANEKAVVTRFGRYHSTNDEGLNFKMPFGIDQVYKVTQTVQAEQFGFRTLQAGVNSTFDQQRDYTNESEMLTGDLNIVDAQWIIEYRIVDPKAWLFNVDNSPVNRFQDFRDKTIRDITQSVVNQLVGDRPILAVMTDDRENVEFQAKQKIQEDLDAFGLGVKLTEVKMQQVVAPKGEVQEAFDDVQKATQDREKLINEGEQAYRAEIPRIEGEAKQMLAEAEGYKSARINRAQGEIALFQAIYDEYRQSKDVTRERLYYETMAKVLANSENTDVIDKGLENFLPLKNLGGAQ
ncbi:MAG: FtsH protease activity modulator HflK [Spirochaetales bacterium]|nr:FtsH protease activity modulator HflK [Spirochaetales bacterium]